MDTLEQAASEVSLLTEDIDRAIDAAIDAADVTKAIGFLVYMQFSIGASWLRVGKLATMIKAKGWFRGYADTWPDFIKDRAYFKVGASEVMKSMRLWRFYCHKHGIPQDELAGYSQDALDAAKPLMTQDGWDETRKHLDLKQGDLRETIKEKTGKEPDWNGYTDRMVAQYKKLCESNMAPWREQFLRETGLCDFDYQKKCDICGALTMLHMHHHKRKSQGGCGLGDLILCSSCHLRLHAGNLTEDETAKYNKALKGRKVDG